MKSLCNFYNWIVHNTECMYCKLEVRELFDDEIMVTA